MTCDTFKDNISLNVSGRIINPIFKFKINI